MLVNTNKEKVCVNELVAQKNDIITVEGDVIVNDIKPDILSTISTNGTVCVYKREVLDGKIRFDGCINIYVMYLADDENGSVRSLNTTLDFTQIFEFDKCKSNMRLDDMITVKDMECKVLNGRKINVKAFLEINAKLYSNEDIEMIREVENISDIQLLQNQLEINSLVGVGNTKVYAKDTVVIDNVDNLAEILKVNTNVINKDIKVSYNKVLAKADMEIKIMYLTEDNRINSIEEKVPIMGFVDIANVSDENICDTKYKLNNMIIKPNNTEEHSIYVEAEFEIVCYAYEKKQIDIIQDLYSPTEELTFTQKTIDTMTPKENKQGICEIKEEISVPEIIDNKIYDVEVKPLIQKTDIQNNQIIYNGEVELKIMYASENTSKIDIKMVKVPFKFELDVQGIEKESNIETNIEIKNQNFIVLQGGYINTTINLEFNVGISKKQKINIIDEIKSDEKRQNEIYSIIIYFVKPGDTLWKIAKQFRSTIEDIVRINGIEDENKIYHGMQLFIPRYVRKMSA